MQSRLGSNRFRDNRVAVLKCYLDDSATSGFPIITLAGFVGDASLWEDIEVKLNEIMDRYEVPVFHAKEFEATKQCFSGWTRIKKRSFVSELAQAAHLKIAGLSATIQKGPIQEWKKATRNLPNMSPFGVAFAGLILRILTHSRLAAEAKKTGLHFFVETGNRNNGELDQYFNLISKWPVFEGALRSITFIPKDDCRAIQLADLYAFYSRRQMCDHDSFAGEQPVPECPYIDILHRHVPLFQIATGIAPINLINDIATFKNAPSLRAWYKSLNKPVVS